LFKKDEWAREQLARMAYNELTLVDVAKALGVSKTYVSEIFSGRAVYNGVRGGNARERVQNAIDTLITEKQKGG
jgi:transcriptional regulator with XRE-family HTH domain